MSVCLSFVCVCFVDLGSMFVVWFVMLSVCLGERGWSLCVYFCLVCGYVCSCNETQTADKQARTKNRARETRMKWDDRSTLFPDGSRLKAPVRSQHHDVCRAHACRETTGMTTENFSRSPDSSTTC